MIKQLANSDITVRPFKTFKHWEIQSVDTNATNSLGESTYYNGKISLSEGISGSGIFYDTGSPYYNPLTNPVNPNGEYKRITYSVTEAMFYNKYNNPFQLFGVENFDRDPITHNTENRNIHDRILVAKIKNGLWGEGINPGTVKIIDDSNIHERYVIVDDTNTNLRISGSQFPYTRNIRPKRFMESQSYWNGSWRYDQSTNRDYYAPDFERFGYDVSAWYKYIAVGSPMDADSFSEAKLGHVQLYKYDSNAKDHRFVKKITSPFTQNSLSQELGTDNSLSIMLEDNSYLYLDIDSGSLTSSLMDEFGSSVYVRDDSLIIGAPNGDHCVSPNPHAGFAYVYEKYKGGTDNWGLVSVFEGSGSNSRFGEAVCVSDDVVAIGAPGVNENRGAVYMFRRKTYSVTGSACDEVSPPSFWNYVSNNTICSRVIVEDGSETLVVGESPAPKFVIGDHTWVLESVLTSSNATTGSYFGSCLEISGDRIIVGCRRENGPGFASLFTASFGSASVNACPTASWSEYKKFVGNNDPADLDPLSPFNGIEGYLPYDGFGRRVAMDGDHIVVCSYYDKSFVPYVGSTDIRTRGAAYFYSYGAIKCLDNMDNFVLTYDFALRFKTFGDTTTIINNNFARDVTIRGTRAIVSSMPDKTSYSVSYSSLLNKFSFERESYETENANDQLGTLGRLSFFDFNPDTFAWDRFKVMKRSKEEGIPNYAYGYSVCLSDFISGSKFLVVGSPVFNQCTGSEYPYVIDKNTQISASFPSKYSGSLYVYDIDSLDESPQIGNIFYKNGQIVLTNTASNYVTVMTGVENKGFNLTYQGSHTILEHEYLITINPGEFNYSTNPSSLVNYPLLFDVNQDGVFDFADIDLILRFLNKQKFYEEVERSDDGTVLEKDTLRDESWWGNDILMTEAGDVLLSEAITIASQSTSSLNTTVFDYIQTKLVDTMILDIDGNGQIDIRDGYLLLNYWSKSLTDSVINQYIDGDSTRRYYIDIKNYIAKYTGELNGYLVDPNFTNYLASSSYDPTGSYLAPTISTIGLYSGYELVAVAKLGRPIKNLIDWPINIIVRFDT